MMCWLMMLVSYVCLMLSMLVVMEILIIFATSLISSSLWFCGIVLLSMLCSRNGEIMFRFVEIVIRIRMMSSWL